MSSSFDGVDLFGSGPHRFIAGRRGSSLLPLGVITSDPFENSVVAIGLRPVQVEVVGRLVGSNVSALRARRDALLAKLTDPPQEGVLVDEDGASWAGIAFIEYEETGPVDRGRVWSVPYRAVFREIESP